MARFFAARRARGLRAQRVDRHAALAAYRRRPRRRLPFTWWTWWAGDALGMLIGAPIVLTLIGRPRDDWAPRRLHRRRCRCCSSTALLAPAIAQVARWDEQRAAHHASSATPRPPRDRLSRRSCSEPLHALEALRGAYLASEHVTRDEFRRATRRLAGAACRTCRRWAGASACRARRAGLRGRRARREPPAPAIRVFDRRDAGRAAPPGDADAVVDALHRAGATQRRRAGRQRAVDPGRARRDRGRRAQRPARPPAPASA